MALPTASNTIPAQEPHFTARGLALFRSNPIAFLRDIAATLDPAIPFRIGKHRIILLNDPELIEQVLVTDQERYGKGPGLLRARSVLGDGLLTADGERHRERRRRLQSPFHRQAVADRMSTMAACEMDATLDWRDGETRDVHAEMASLTLNIAATAIFSSRRTPDSASITGAVSDAIRATYGRLSNPAMRPDSSCPHLAAQARRTLENAAGELLGGYRPGPRPSLPEILAQDVADGESSEIEAMDEAVTFLIAGHESAANALTWTWTLLAQNPAWESAFHDEIGALGEEDLTSMETLESLDVTRRILSESLRLYPPAWMISRQSIEPVTIGSLGELPRGTVVIAAQCVTHHDGRLYPAPDRFDPDRWLPRNVETRPRFAFFPFGGGPRLCIAERFAWFELLSALAVIGRAWEFRLESAPPEPDPVITLRPRGGAPMRFVRRSS